MPRQKNKTKKTSKASPKKAKVTKKNISKRSLQKDSISKSVPERLKLDESYASLFLGGLVVVFLIVFLILVLGGKKAVNEMQIKLSPTPSPATVSNKQKTYVLKEGEGLWDVALKFYGDGYRWVDIATANGFDPNYSDFVSPGTKLIIPR